MVQDGMENYQVVWEMKVNGGQEPALITSSKVPNLDKMSKEIQDLKKKKNPGLSSYVWNKKRPK